MKRILLAVCLVVCNTSWANGAGESAETAQAAIQSLAGALKSELQAAMQSGGPTAAIEICNTRAMPLTAKVAAEHGLQLARVSLKNRNPANQANAWQAAVLRDFEARAEQGEDVSQLAWSETADTGGTREFRLMKAIPTGGVCLACHGQALSPEVSQVLNALYPDDWATGYSEGDIRGAFVVTKIIPE